MAVRRYGVAIAFCAIACGGDVGDGNTSGTLGAECASDTACGTDLVCVQGQCAVDEGTHQGGSGGSSTGGKPGTTGGAPSSGGIAGSGGIGTGGTPTLTGGTGPTGGANTGGALSSGGAAGGPVFECTPNDPTLSECDACVQANCCNELLDCANDMTCAGDGTNEGEMICVIACMDAVISQNDVATQDDLLMCGAQCAMENDVVAPSTSDLLSCMVTSVCGEVCLGLYPAF